MLSLFKKTNTLPPCDYQDFEYLSPKDFYFDSACQTLRPWQVVEAQNDYYRSYNACGERVKYEWGRRVDEKVLKSRQALLKLVGKSEKEYTVVFTLNTSYGINLVLQQLPAKNFQRIITSEIEHNSVFLPTMTWAKRYNLERLVLPRDEKGNLLFDEKVLGKAVVVVNTVSNIDGRKLQNLKELSHKIHQAGGVLLLDGAQHFGHDVIDLKSADFDAICGSGHKMYGPSIGFIIIKKDLLKKLDHFWLGGGTVTDVTKDHYELIEEEDELHARLEVGLQNWAGIVGLEKAVSWLQEYKPSGLDRVEYEKNLTEKLWQELGSFPELHLVNHGASTVVSFYHDRIDAHRLALYLSEQGIMCRSGYFCCHYYLKNLKKYPPLLRISLGLQTKESDIDYLKNTLQKIFKAL